MLQICFFYRQDKEKAASCVFDPCSNWDTQLLLIVNKEKTDIPIKVYLLLLLDKVLTYTILMSDLIFLIFV